jgi:hypothetical protein
LKAAGIAQEEAQMAADQAKNEAQKAADEEIEEAQITADKAHKAAAEAQKAADEAFVALGFDFDMNVRVTSVGTTSRPNQIC